MAKPLPHDDAGCGWYNVLPPPGPARRVAGDETADWVVLGAGITGLAAARRLAELAPDARILLIEAQRVGYGATGRNAGFILETPHYTEGWPKARSERLLRIFRAGADYLREAVARHDIDCQWTETGQLKGAHGDVAMPYLEGYCKALDDHDLPYERLDAEGGLQWPCPTEDHPGTEYLHADEMESGLPGYFAPVDHIPPAEPTDSEYPLVLTTGRRRSTYHTGTQTGRASGFDLLVATELAEINPYDADQLELTDGETIVVRSRRGEVEVPVLITDKSPHGTIFMSFAFPELTQTNRLTSDAYDFITETPEFKACAVRIEKIAPVTASAD